MADYIVLEDVKHTHFNQFPEETRQPYIDEANAWYEDFADTLGLFPEQLTTPIPLLAKRLLANYALMRFSEDNIGSTDISTEDGEDVYQKYYNHYQKSVQDVKVQITPEMLQGLKTGRVGRSVSFGKLFRT